MASIKKRGDTYTIMVSLGYDSAGAQIRKYMTYKPDKSLTERQIEKEVNRQAVLFEDKCKKGLHLDGTITFAEFTGKWIKDYAEKQLAPKTVHEYKKILENRIIPAFGHLRINRIQPPHILSFYNDLSENGVRLDVKFKLNQEYVDYIKTNRKMIDCIAENTLQNIINGGLTTKEAAEKLSNSTNIPFNEIFTAEQKSAKLTGDALNHCHRLLNTILNAAVQWQIIDDNPCRRVKPPKKEKKEAKHYDEAQVAVMFSFLEKEEIYVKLAVYMGVFTGIRLGELSALSWDDINFKDKILTINKARQYIPKRGSFEKDTKTISSNRIVSLPDMVIELLKSYRSWQLKLKYQMGDKWQESRKIFTGDYGNEIFPTTPSKWFARFIKKNNLDKITFHQLRHTNASLLISQGVDIVTVSKRLGHAKTSTTTDIYSHIIKKADTEAANKLDDLFNPASGKNKKSQA